jgi:REP element-mobilizing transposase RayT
MPFLKIWIHAIWATKGQQKIVSEKIRLKLIEHITEYGQRKGIDIDCINGHWDHMHCLLSLKSDQNIATIMNLIKGESSHWINKNKLTYVKFGWQDEYFAVSVSHSHVENVRKYIRLQEEHHKKRGFRQEVDLFMERYGFELVKD